MGTINNLELSEGAVPAELFSHVEASFDNGFKQNALFYICHNINREVYWIAQASMVCGPICRLKYIGADNDFWCDISRCKIKQLDWCGVNNELIEPPDDIKQKYGDKISDLVKEALVNGHSVSDEAISCNGLPLVGRFKPDTKLAVQNAIDPSKHSIATVSKNIGGRLLLHYDNSSDDLSQFWIFFTSSRLNIYDRATNKSNMNSEAHKFVVGMKLEALDPHKRKCIRPATVTKVFNNLHFLVVIDDHSEDYEDTKMAWLCDSFHPYIYPIGWAEKNSICFKRPKVWQKCAPFDWHDYLKMTSSIPAPDHCFGTKEPLEGLKVNMKLEAVNPRNREEIYAATIHTIVEHMVCVELLSMRERFWYAQRSHSLLPVGWCEINGYKLQPSHINCDFVKSSQFVQQSECTRIKTRNSEECCEKIYINYKCRSGPLISRMKLSLLPKYIGPGPLSLVLKDTLNKIISASYNPLSVLRRLETKSTLEMGMKLETLRAKFNKSTHHARVPIVTCAESVSSFCRNVCVILQACPCLFGPHDGSGQCPQNCQLGNLSKRRAKANSTRCTAEDKKTPERKKRPKKTYPPMTMKTRGVKLPDYSTLMKGAHQGNK